MWVAELACPNGHGFEGWFGSREDFESQRGRGLVQCPQCGSAAVERRLSAPRLNMGAAEPAPPKPDGKLRELMAALLANTEDLGKGFAAEARRIAQGDAPERAIRGQVSVAECEALLDEGITVLPLPALDLQGDDGLH